MSIKYKQYNSQGGVAVIITILLIGFLLSMVLALSAIFIPKIRASGEIKNSVGAIYAADSAVEWCVYQARKGVIAQPIMLNGSSFTVTPPSCISPIKALGTHRGVTRAFEVSF